MGCLRFGSDACLAVMMTRMKNLYEDSRVLGSELNQGVPQYETGVSVTERQETRRRTLLSALSVIQGVPGGMCETSGECSLC